MPSHSPLTYDAIERARDRAARHAEIDLSYNGNLECELALDVLAAFVDGIDTRITRMFVMTGRNAGKRALTAKLADPGKRLAWSLSLTDRRKDLKPHEVKLLADAWARVVALGEDQKWERMGHGG